MRIGSFWSLLFCLGLSSVAYAQDVGDVTGDGRVDGKDALKVARILEGLVEPTGEDLRLGDVYPVPGVERRIGDGRLTDEDVVRILRYSVKKRIVRRSVINIHRNQITITGLSCISCLSIKFVIQSRFCFVKTFKLVVSTSSKNYCN